MGNGYSIRHVGGQEQPELYEISICSRETLTKITGMPEELISDVPIGSCVVVYDPVSKSVAPEFSDNAAYEDGQIERAIFARFCQEAELEVRADFERRHEMAKWQSAERSPRRSGS